MKVYNTSDAQHKPSIVMLVYGQGGVGKSTFASTAPKPIMADCENGAKYFGLRGIKLDVALIEKWDDMHEFYKLVKDGGFETVVVDPIGELMEKLMTSIKTSNNKKLVQADGSLTMAGWGEAKDRMRKFIKTFRDLGKHAIFIAHVQEDKDQDSLIKRPKVATKISDELVNLVDIVAFMTFVKDPADPDAGFQRAFLLDQDTDKYIAKDRTGQFGKYIMNPNFNDMAKEVVNSKVWSLKEEPKDQPKTEAPAEKPVDAKTTQVNKAQGLLAKQKETAHASK
jgi:hypothetical protein